MMSLLLSDDVVDHDDMLLLLTMLINVCIAGKVALQRESEELRMELGDLLQFVTGTRHIPAEGFVAPLAIMFNHSNPIRKISANTCACSLYLPVNEKLMRLESMAQEFIEAVFDGQGFGNA